MAMNEGLDAELRMQGHALALPRAGKTLGPAGIAELLLARSAPCLGYRCIFEWHCRYPLSFGKRRSANRSNLRAQAINVRAVKIRISRVEPGFKPNEKHFDLVEFITRCPLVLDTQRLADLIQLVFLNAASLAIPKVEPSPVLKMRKRACPPDGVLDELPRRSR
ncbi:hypothetical protein [uncultured Bradyrhizobium sp.]|uniref:hypothetical protein n=1 Tax=uncultured Bradyrhizobium sp. TaxID=199684 RepID=UPI0035CC8C63